MNYESIYCRLISKRILCPPTSSVVEVHHIIPTCINGSNSSDNLVSLTPREHYIAHLLLCKMYPTNTPLKYALRMMGVANAHQIYRRTGVMYEKIKKEMYMEHSKFMSKRIPIHCLETNITKLHLKNEPIPVGWSKGSNQKNTLGKYRYYNVELDKEIMINDENNIPCGFTKGRRSFSMLYSADGKKMWDVGQSYDDTEWFDFSVRDVDYINLSSGEKVTVKNCHSAPKGFVMNRADSTRSILCRHLRTRNTGVLTFEEYEQNVLWVRANLPQDYIFVTNIGPVRNKSEYQKRTGLQINLKKYCNESSIVISEWIVKRSNLPTEWKNRTWHEVGFGIEYF